MPWVIDYHYRFADEIDAFPDDVKIELFAHAERLAVRGPLTPRPLVDTLKGSKHANMKELRFDAGGGVWRVAFAFDPRRHALLLVAGDKSGVATAEFYRRLIARADERFDEHLRALKSQGKTSTDRKT
jgi:hypothetical protein